MTRPNRTASRAFQAVRGRGWTIARFTRNRIHRAIQPLVRHDWRIQTHVRLDVRRGMGIRTISKPSRSSRSTSFEAVFVGRAMIVTSCPASTMVAASRRTRASLRQSL